MAALLALLNPLSLENCLSLNENRWQGKRSDCFVYCIMKYSRLLNVQNRSMQE